MFVMGLAMWLLVFAALIQSADVLKSKAAVTDQPIIGILSLPWEPQTQEKNSYIAASYVKWLEGGGARVVPIPYDVDMATLEHLFDSLNAILFTGGASFQDPVYFKAAKFLYEKTLESNLKDDFMPLWGTCLGFELLAVLGSGRSDALDDVRYDAYNISLPITFTDDASTSRLFGPIYNTALWDVYRTESVTANEHEQGISPERFKSVGLDTQYRVLSVNEDRKGVPFVSSFEALQWPIYAVQWHPEKVQYEWEREHDTAHSSEAIMAAQYMAEFFVNEARYSSHRFVKAQEEDQLLIYNHDPANTFNLTKGHFAQTYFFPQQ